MKMYLYLLEATDYGLDMMPGWEVNNAMIVLARTPAQARRLAAEKVIDEPPACWTEPVNSTCQRIGLVYSATFSRKPRVLVADNNAS